MAVRNEMLHGEPVDEEWIYLLTTAREMGITPEVIRSFLSEASRPPNESNNSKSDEQYDYIDLKGNNHKVKYSGSDG